MKWMFWLIFILFSLESILLVGSVCVTKSSLTCMSTFSFNGVTYGEDTANDCKYDYALNQSWCYTTDKRWDYCEQTMCKDDFLEDCKYDQFEAVEHGSKYVYRLFDNIATFGQAQEVCAQVGARLAHADTTEDLREIKKFYMTRSVGLMTTTGKPYRRQAWIGVSFDKFNGSYAYWTYTGISRKLLYGEFSIDHFDGVPCGRIRIDAIEGGLVFDDTPCNKYFYPLCQRECPYNPYNQYMGVFTGWKPWSACRQQTDKVWITSRTRECLNPWSPNKAAVKCDPTKPSYMERQCSINLGYEGQFNDWSTWSECYQNGFNTSWVKARGRKCDTYDSPNILCDPTEATFEEIKCPPVNGGWSEWTASSDEFCFENQSGILVKPQTRTCSNPKPLYGGGCKGPSRELIPCFLPEERVCVTQNNEKCNSSFWYDNVPYGNNTGHECKYDYAHNKSWCYTSGENWDYCDETKCSDDYLEDCQTDQFEGIKTKTKFVYRLLDTTATFYRAREVCAQFGARLAQAENAEDLREIKQFYKSRSKVFSRSGQANRKQAWIGLKIQKIEGGLNWLDSTWDFDKGIEATFEKNGFLIDYDSEKACGRLRIDDTDGKIIFDAAACIQQFYPLCQRLCPYNPYKQYMGSLTGWKWSGCHKLPDSDTWMESKQKYCYNSWSPDNDGVECVPGKPTFEEMECEPSSYENEFQSWSSWSDCYRRNKFDKSWIKVRTRECNITGTCDPSMSTIQESVCISINGGWSDWVISSDENCFENEEGVLVKAKERICNNPFPLYGGNCSGLSLDFVECDIVQSIQNTYSRSSRISSVLSPNSPTYSLTPNSPTYSLTPSVDGGWSNWTVMDNKHCKIAYNLSSYHIMLELNECPACLQIQESWVDAQLENCSTCLQDEKYFKPYVFAKPMWRSCDNPKPSFNGAYCQPDDYGMEYSTTLCKPINGNWSQETFPGDCFEAEDGVWQRELNRTCSNPYPKFGGSDCQPLKPEYEKCPPIDGGWSSWFEEPNRDNCTLYNSTTWVRPSYRYCTNPVPKYGGKYCDGNSTGYAVCAKIDGGWSSWYDEQNDDNCTLFNKTTWVKPGYRYCNNPAPQNGGKYCAGNWTELVPCTKIDGGWSSWYEEPNKDNCTFFNSTTWVKLNYRSCTNPPPKLGGKACDGKSKRLVPCIKIDGGWSSWYDEQSDGNCSFFNKTTWVKPSYRYCNNPKPKNGGQYCIGNSTRMVPCAKTDGNWSPWNITDMDNCTYHQESDSWRRVKVRTCNDPEPKYGGLDCPKSENIYNVSYEICPPINGQWSDFEVFENCSEECTSSKVRLCNDPSPMFGGSMCSGPDMQFEFCEQCTTVDDCLEFIEYDAEPLLQLMSFLPTNVGECREKCLRIDRCELFTMKLSPSKDMATCSLYEYTNATIDSSPDVALSGPKHCPIHGNWSEFGPWGMCSESCEGGIQLRHRYCDSPMPQYRGDPCQGNSFEQMECNNFNCSEAGFSWPVVYVYPFGCSQTALADCSNAAGVE